MKSHPELKALEGVEPASKWVALALVGLQLWLSVHAPRWSWSMYAIAVYVGGATLAQALFLAIHELSHNLFFKSLRYNRWFAFVCNLPLVIPFTVDFRVHHLNHHAHLGVRGADTDLPSAWEGRWVCGPLSKLLWCSLQIVAYAIRPMLSVPPVITRMHVASWVVQIGADGLLVWWYGTGAPLRFLLLSMIVAGGFHPCAGHFLSEHYMFETAGSNGTQETFSYYGPLNVLTFNVGYHCEHHDLPLVPWSRLPRVRAIAPEFYNHLTPSPPWTRIMWEYVSRSDMGPNRRRVRHCR